MEPCRGVGPHPIITSTIPDQGTQSLIHYLRLGQQLPNLVYRCGYLVILVDQVCFTPDLPVQSCPVLTGIYVNSTGAKYM